MPKKFNDTGLCIPGEHFMADTSDKLSQILALVRDGAYFTINRPRQYGKTTIAFLLSQHLDETKEFYLTEMSFEGIGDKVFEDEEHFGEMFLRKLRKEFGRLSKPELQALIDQKKAAVKTLDHLSEAITEICTLSDQKIVLTIDEIDKSSSNQLFMSFLGMLREKYLQNKKSRDQTFQSVILIGVHDIKTLKLKISSEEKGKLNSPWNIAVDFGVEMHFMVNEIEPMLAEYCKVRGVKMDVAAMAHQIFYYTFGYPFLVSKICKIADEILLPRQTEKKWDFELIEAAFKYLVNEAYTTTIFDDLAKNLENNQQLYDVIFKMIINGEKVAYNPLELVINQGILYGLIRNKGGFCQVHNRVFEQKIYGYMLARAARERSSFLGVQSGEFYQGDGLNLKAILRKFQQFLKENHSDKDQKFLEREGRLLFLSYLKPIINGKGFDFKEPNVAHERRMDLVLTFGTHRYVVELKRWQGEGYHQEGIKQLSDYLNTYSLKKGFLLIYDFRKSKVYQEKLIQFDDKEIFAVWV